MLAQMEPTASPLLREAAEKALHVVGQTQDLVVVSTRDLTEAVGSDESLSNMLQPWIRRGSIRWINVSREIDRWVVRDTSDMLTASSSDRSSQPAETLRSGAIES